MSTTNISKMSYAELNALSSNASRWAKLSDLNRMKVSSRMEKLGGNSTAAPASGTVGTSRVSTLPMPSNSKWAKDTWNAALAAKASAKRRNRRTTRRNRKNRSNTRRNRK